jgi:TM2 domain-containing membrane protein YozV
MRGWRRISWQRRAATARNLVPLGKTANVTISTTSAAPAKNPSTYPTNTHSIAMGYLCWIFGFVGLHRFYYGKRITGTIWFFTFGLFGIGWLIDLFLIPSMDASADRHYATGPYDYTIAWLLMFFPLGVFGIHRLYLGKIVTGLIWFFTGGLFGLGWLYDLWTLNEQVNDKNLEALHAA